MLQIATEAARAGGKVLLQKFGSTLQVAYKGDVDLVTEADVAAETAIVEVIRGTFPRHNILAEEQDYGDEESAYCWIIDPLDGTTNYAHGVPWFSVSVALAVNRQVVLGVVLHPFSGELFHAELGKGAYVNDIPLQVSKTLHLDQALLATGFPYDRKTSSENNYQHFIAFQQSAQACRRAGSAALDLAYTAAGRFDGYWELKLKPWDVAAGQLLVSEAGGVVSDFSGQALKLDGGETLASNGQIHEAMLEVLASGRQD